MKRHPPMTQVQFAKGDSFQRIYLQRKAEYNLNHHSVEDLVHSLKLQDKSCSSGNFDSDLNMKTEIDQLCTAQEHLNVVDSDAAGLAMSFVDQESGKNDHIERLKNDTNFYVGMSDEISKDCNIIFRAADESKNKLQEFNLSSETSYEMEKKILAYKNDLAKFERKHSWLKNPEFDLTYIAKEAQILASMQEEKEALEKELEVYEGLKPDLQEAAHQLSIVKKQYKELKDKLYQVVS